MDHPQQLQQIINYSEQMLECAQDSDWRTVAEMEAKQRLMMEKFFAQPSLPTDVLEQKIPRLLEIQDTIIAVTCKEREQYQSDLKQNRVGKKMIKAYK